MKSTIILCLMLLLSAPCLAATYYLKTDGNDLLNGTSWATAWKTLSKCQSTLTSGDTVLMRDGRYGMWSKQLTASNTNWITYQAADDNGAVEINNIWIRSSASTINGYIKFVGINVTTGDYSSNQGFVNASVAAHGPYIRTLISTIRYIQMIDCNVIGIGYIRTAGDATDKRNGIYLNNADNVTLLRCHVTGYEPEDYNCSFTYGITISANSDNAEINDCNVQGTWRGIESNGGKNLKIVYSEVHDGYQDGIYIDGGLNSTGEELLIAYNHVWNFFVNPQGDHTDLIQFGNLAGKLYNVVVRGNICHNSDHQIWWFNPPVGSGPCLIENNLCYNDDMYGQGVNAIKIGNMSTVASGSLIIRNNIFDVSMMQADYGNHYDQLTGNIIRNLNWDWDYEFEPTKSPGPITCDLENFNIVYRWGSYTDSHVKGANDITLTTETQFNALFANRPDGNYYPSATSLAKGLVPLTYAPAIDINGVTRTNPTDAGVYEANDTNDPIEGDPCMSVSATKLEFGTVLVGDTCDINFTITNIGDGTLTGALTKSDDLFTFLGTASFSLGAGEVCDVNIRYTPIRADSNTDWLFVNQPVFPYQRHKLKMTGTGVAIITVVPGLSYGGRIAVGATSDVSYAVHNNTAGAVTVTASGLSAPLSIIEGATLSLGAHGTAEANGTTTIRFAPTEVIYTEQFLVFEATGGGGATRRVVWSSYTDGSLTVLPTAVDCGQVAVGQSKSYTVTAYNVGSLDANTTIAISDANNFSVTPTSLMIGGYDYIFITVTFNPLTTGTKTATLTVVGGNTTTVSLVGAGTAALYYPICNIPSSQ